MSVEPGSKSKPSGHPSLAADVQKAMDALKASVKNYPDTEKSDHLPPVDFQSLEKAATYIHSFLKGRGHQYYFCGGFACISIGHSSRSTRDVDIVVTHPEALKDTISLFGTDPHFIYEKAISTHPFFYVEETKELVEIDCLPDGWGGNFPKISGARIIELRGFKFLSHETLLRMKLKAWGDTNRRQSAKRIGDQLDIVSLRAVMIGRGDKFTGKLTDAERVGLRAWYNEFHDARSWREVGIIERDADCLIS